jgi:hypothetical protein
VRATAAFSVLPRFLRVRPHPCLNGMGLMDIRRTIQILNSRGANSCFAKHSIRIQQYSSFRMECDSPKKLVRSR